MRKHALAVAATIVCAVATPHVAHAAEIDMAKMRCKSVLQSSDRGAATFMWVSGYFAAKAGETIFDTDRHVRAAGRLGQLCRLNPNASVLELYRRALDEVSGKL